MSEYITFLSSLIKRDTLLSDEENDKLEILRNKATEEDTNVTKTSVTKETKVETFYTRNGLSMSWEF